MSASVKKKQVRFASMEDDERDAQEEEEEEEEDEEDTLFDKRKDAGGLKSVLKAARRGAPPGPEQRVEVAGGAREGPGTCGRWMVTLALCASFLGLGMSISVLGPTFEDLAVNVKKNISNISYIFVGRSAGYIGGSLFGGALIDCVNPNILLGGSMLFTAVGMCSIPFCKQALLLTVFMSAIGVSMGVLDTGGNVLILNTWGEQAGPHLQALHFSFAAGAFVSPIIAKLLFGNDDDAAAAAPGNSTPPLPPPRVTGAHPALLQLIHGRTATFRSMWAYVVIGAFVFLVAFVFFVLYARGGPPRGRAHSSSAAGKPPPVARHHLALVVLLFFFFFAYVGAEVAYGSFIFTYAKDFAGMPAPQAAGLNSLFWGAFAACRGLAIFLAACLYPGTLILLSLVGTTLSSLLLCMLGRRRAALWLGTGLYGASMSVTFPSGIAWAEQYTAVTGRTAAAFVVGAALGEMVLPALVGALLGVAPRQPLLMYAALLASTCTAVLFPVMYKLATAPAGPAGKPRGAGGGRADADDSEYRRALLPADAEEEEEEEDEADQWNDADFEVIEMDDAYSLADSPSGATAAAPPDAAVAAEEAPSYAGPLGVESPRRKLLLSLDREKRD